MSDSELITLPITPPVAREVSNPAARQLNILGEEARHTESQERFSRGPDRAYKKRVCTAAATGDWETASSYDNTYPNWIRTPLTMDKDTALHIAVRMEQIKFVTNLVERITEKDMEIRRVDGNNAFCLAAISGNVKIARILCDKNPELVCIKGHKENLPIQLASSAGQLDMVKFLLHRTQQDNHIKDLSFEDIVKLFFLTITNNVYNDSNILLDKNPKLACIENEDEITALQLLAQSPSHKHAPGYMELLKLLIKKIEEEEEEDQLVQFIQTRKAMFDAAKSGNIIILELIFNHNPNLFLEIDCKGHSLLHIAILYRKGDVYRLIFKKGSYKKVLMQHIDYEGNNILHLAGKFAFEERFGSPTHQALICCEELWFKEVEHIVPPAFKSMKNNQGLTPKELFYREHRRSSEKAIEEVNGIANTFIVVATLIITLGISGALTIRTNNISSKSLLFCDQNIWYMIFILSIGIGVSFSASSVLQFTSVILPSTWRSKGGYVYSRIIRMTFGYLSLYAAAFYMGLFSTMSGVILVFNFLPPWVFLVIIPLIIIPVISYVSFSYYSLYVSARLVKVFFQQRLEMILSREHYPLNYLE